MTHVCVLVVRRGKVLIERRPSTGMWAGMWQPPTVEEAVSIEELGARVGVRGPFEEVARFTHVTTHREVRFVVVRKKGRVGERVGPGRVWVDERELTLRGVSNAHARILGMAWPIAKKP